MGRVYSCTGSTVSLILEIQPLPYGTNELTPKSSKENPKFSRGFDITNHSLARTNTPKYSVIVVDNGRSHCIMDQDVGYSVEQIENRPLKLNYLLALPTELLVFILSFLNGTRDIVKLRYVSRRLRGVCETPSLWRQFIWPHFDIREYRCVKTVLKSCGQYINYLSFPDHVTVSKLALMLQHCSNLVELRLSTNKLNCDHLRRATESMGKLQTLDIMWDSEISPLLVICSRLNQLTIRQKGVHSCDILNEWAMKRFVPKTLNIFSCNYPYYIKESLQQWLSLNSNSPIAHTSYLNVYGRSKVPMDLSPLLPDFQLQFGQSCTLPYVQASKYGLLGLIADHLLLTNCTTGTKTLGKAKLQVHSMHNSTCLNNDIDNLTFISHFDASFCQLHSGHLEQLAMACPNLLELNLRGNKNCLKRLQGLHKIVACCQNLRGLNLSLISVDDMENQVQLWELFTDLKLTYLAINLCALIPSEVDQQAIFISYQDCRYLKALEFFGDYCSKCKRVWELSSLSHFSSLEHLCAENVKHLVVIKEILGGCKQLKHFICSSLSSWFNPTCPLVINCSLEQLYIQCSSANVPDTFMESISTHGKLVHVIMEAGSVTGIGITTLIRNSPKLMTCHIEADHLVPDSKSQGDRLKLRHFKMTLKQNFYDRKLFSCGCYFLAIQRGHRCNLMTLDSTELVPLF